MSDFPGKVRIIYYKYAVVLGPGNRPNTIRYCALRSYDKESGKVELSISQCSVRIAKERFRASCDPFHYGRTKDSVMMFDIRQTGIYSDGRVTMQPQYMTTPFAIAVEKFEMAIMEVGHFAAKEVI